MNYFYDIIINMNEEKDFKFYEWENYDVLELIKKIPLLRVSTKTLKDFYLYDIKVSKEFVNSLLDKTLIKNNKINKTIKYACILCDTKNTLVVEFDEEGNAISRSCLLLEDEANIIEFIYNCKENKIDYQRLGVRSLERKLRQEDLVKKVIKTEFNTLLANKNISKLKYLFNEWFGYEEDDIDKINEIVLTELSKDFNFKTKDVYDLIILSYNR